MGGDEHLIVKTKDRIIHRCAVQVYLNVRVVIQITKLVEGRLDTCRERSPQLFFPTAFSYIDGSWVGDSDSLDKSSQLSP